MKQTLAERLDKRKIKQPPFLANSLLRIYGRFLKKKFNAHISYIDQLPKKGPCIILFNHLSRLDFVFVALAAKSRRINFVAAYHEHFYKKYYRIFQLSHTIPKRNFVTDLKAIANIKEAIQKGYAVAIAPEGRNANYGTNAPIMKGTGMFLTQFKVPIYFIKIQGSYLTFPKFNNDARKGKISVIVKRLSFENVKSDCLDDYINEQFKNNEFEWQSKEHIKWTHKCGMADGIESILFQCPKCHKEFTISGKGEKIVCSHCGYKAKLDEYYTLNSPIKKITNISEWVRFERINIIKNIRKDKKYSFQIPVKLEMLDKYHPFKTPMGKACGHGVITIDHHGIYFNGEKNNSSFQLNLTYQDVKTTGITQAIRSFFFYYQNEFYNFVPEYRCAFKVKMLVEEMQRLHYNIWPNFKWEKELYHR